MNNHDRFRGCLLGLAIGDAVGTTVEFRPRGSFTPVTDMVGGGPFNLLPGQWTDDTSMALCLADSLIERRRFDAKDQMERYRRWWRKGYRSSTGRCFDIGNTTSAALGWFERTGDPFSGTTDPYAAGNGCLMRLAPVPMAYFPNREAAAAASAESSRTTHGAAECLEASRLFGAMLTLALGGASPDDILLRHGVDDLSSPRLAAIARGDYRDSPESDIRGNGYVVDSLEAALWAFATTDSFEAAVLRAVNLGDDADTTGAITGQIAGAFYGESNIPAHWRARVYLGDEIGALADELTRLGLSELGDRQ